MDDRQRPPEYVEEPLASPFMEAPDAPAAKGGAPRRRNPLPIALGAAAASAIVIALVLWGIAPRDAPVAQATAGGDKGDVLAPIRPRADVQTGEQVAPFSGFAVSVETDPAGAVVTIAGVPRGEAPVLAGVDCKAGDRVEISAEKQGWPVARTATACRADALVKLTVRLRR